jgi:hypothetical protein
MKEFNISSKSWHYHLVENFTTYTVKNINNFCDYTKAVLVGILMIPVSIAAGAALCYFL